MVQSSQAVQRERLEAKMSITGIEFIDIPTEQTTAATDALLALLTLGCILYLRRMRQHEPWKTNIWSWAFGFMTLSGALGVVVHGFKMSESANDLWWQPINLVLGLTVSLFVVGVVYDLWGHTTARRLLPIMLVIGVGFYAITRIIPGTFLVFIVYEALALLFALGAYGWLAIQKRLQGAGLMAAGILVSIIAAGIQASEAVSVTFIWEFNHNGIFHLLQLVGFLLLLAGLRSALLTNKIAKNA
jgi:hypothetical protein